MPRPGRYAWRGRLFALAILFATVSSQAATVSYRVPDSPWVQAMLMMMEAMGLLEPAPPAAGRYPIGNSPWSSGWPVSGWGAMPNSWLGGGSPDFLPDGGAANFWAVPNRWGNWQRPAMDPLRGLWLSPDREALWFDGDGFAYRDAAGRSIGGRLYRQGDRLAVELPDGARMSMRYRLQGPNLQLLDPGGQLRQFRRIR